MLVSSIRLGHAVGFVAETLLSELPRVAWTATATSRDVARFVRHASLVNQ